MAAIDPELLAVFQTETAESLGVIQEHLLRVEQGSGDAEERLRDVLRLAHDLKGSARVVGLAEAGHLAHAIETRLKSWDRSAAVPRHELDLVLSAVDLLGALVDRADGSDASLAARAEQAARLLEDVGSPPAADPLADAAPGDAAVPAADAAAARAEALATDAERSTAPVADAAAAPDAIPAPAPRVPAARHGDTLRVSWGLVDDVSRSVAEVRVCTEGAYGDCRRLDQELQAIEDVRLSYASSSGRAILDGRNRMRRVLWQTQSRVQQLVTRVTELALLVDELSLVSTGGLTTFLERLVRDTARALGKDVAFVTSGADQPLDGQVLQALKGPLTHMVRNAVDHGLEDPATRARAGKPARGTVTLAFEQSEGRIRITVADDGSGVDLDTLRRRLGAGLTDDELLARLLDPGVTTRERVSEFSGRGIGLDAVAAEVERLHGHVSIRTERGAGTSVVLDMPAQLMLVHGIHALAGNVHVVLPLADLTIPDDPGPRPGDPRLSTWLGFEDERAAQDVVAVRREDGPARFGVDRILGEVEVVRRPMSVHLGELPGIQGCAVLLDGNPALILDVRALSAGREGACRRRRAAGPAPRVLVVDDSTTMRSILHEALTACGFDVTLAEDGDAALRLLATRSFDAVVSDVQMPRCDGWRLLDEVGDRQPFVLATSRPAPADEARARDAGALAYVNKDDEVGPRVASLLESVLSPMEPDP